MRPHEIELFINTEATPDGRAYWDAMSRADKDEVITQVLLAEDHDGAMRSKLERVESWAKIETDYTDFCAASS
jgi:hypothetical protein